MMTERCPFLDIARFSFAAGYEKQTGLILCVKVVRLFLGRRCGFLLEVC